MAERIYNELAGRGYVTHICDVDRNKVGRIRSNGMGAPYQIAFGDDKKWCNIDFISRENAKAALIARFEKRVILPKPCVRCDPPWDAYWTCESMPGAELNQEQAAYWNDCIRHMKFLNGIE